MPLKVIAFDADDTLFVNETYFLETEEKFCELMSDYLSHKGIAQELFRIEIHNLNFDFSLFSYFKLQINAFRCPTVFCLLCGGNAFARL